MQTTVRKQLLLFYWSMTIGLVFLTGVFSFFINEPDYKILPFIAFGLFAVTLYWSINLQTTKLIISEKEIIKKSIFKVKRLVWKEVELILIDPDYHCRIITGLDRMQLRISQLRKQGELKGKIETIGAGKIEKSIYFNDVKDLHRTRWLFLLIPIVLVSFFVLKDYFILVGLAFGIISNLLRIYRFMIRSQFEAKISDSIFVIIIFSIGFFWMENNPSPINDFLRVGIMFIAGVTGMQLVNTLFRGVIKKKAEEIGLTMEMK